MLFCAALVQKLYESGFFLCDLQKRNLLSNFEQPKDESVHRPVCGCGAKVPRRRPFGGGAFGDRVQAGPAASAEGMRQDRAVCCAV